MILNLSDVLSEQHKPIHQSVPIEMTCFRSEMGNYVITLIIFCEIMLLAFWL